MDTVLANHTQIQYTIGACGLSPHPRNRRLAKVLPQFSADGKTLLGYGIFCPACKFAHVFNVPGARKDGVSWSFNGDHDRPTFQPSMNAYTVPTRDETPPWRCHSFVTAGRIQFLGDCTHSMAGQTVDLPDFPTGYSMGGGS